MTSQFLETLQKEKERLQSNILKKSEEMLFLEEVLERNPKFSSLKSIIDCKLEDLLIAHLLSDKLDVPFFD